ncbi:hypothetical protein Tco_0123178 [Tanacetum coccineum]
MLTPNPKDCGLSQGLSGCLPLHFLSLEVDLVKTYCIPQDLHPRLPDPGFTMVRFPGDAIGVYTEFLWFSGVHIPFIRAQVFQDIVPTVTLFCMFQCLCKQGDWFSFSKCRNTEDVCMDDAPSSLKKRADCLKPVSRVVVSPLGEHVLPTDGYDWNDVEQLCARLIRHEMKEEVLVRSKMSIYDFMALPSWSDAKVVEESHNLSKSLLDHVSSHTTAPIVEGAMIPLPTADEIAASLPDPRLAKNQQLKRRKLRKRASEPGSSAPELGQTECVDEADLTNFCTEIKNSLERDEGTSVRAALAPVPRLGKKLGAPPFVSDVSASGPSPIGTSVHASTFGRNISLGGAIASGHVGKSMVEVMRRQLDPLDSLARSALARDAEYDQIPDDDFSTATLGEEIDLTLFPLAPGPYHTPYPYEGVSSPLYTKEEKALDQTITPAELRRTESLLPLELSNHVNILSALLVSHDYELNSHYTNLVSSKSLLQEKLNLKKGDVRLLHLEVTFLDDKLEKLQRDYDALGQENRELCSQRDVASKEIDAKLSEKAVTMRDFHNELALERSKSQSYKNSANELRAEIAYFIGSGVEGLVRKLLSSDKFHAALAHVASLGINYGVKTGLGMGRTDADFEMAVQKVSSFQVGAKADFDKALVGFPTTPFPFLGKLFIGELSWEGEDFVLPPFHW